MEEILYPGAVPAGKERGKMRLIDADKLYDWVRTECNPYGKPTIDFESGCRMLDIIKRMPTAFDKEKVIKEIRNVPHGYYNVDTENEIIGIVEKGGIE